MSGPGRVTVIETPAAGDEPGGDRLVIAVAAAGALRTARAGVFAAVLNGFVVSLVLAVWTQNPNAWNGRGMIGLALMAVGGLAVAAPFLWAWAKRAFTRTLILVDEKAVVVRTRWDVWGLPLAKLGVPGRTTRDPRGPADHATARRRGAWWWPGGSVRTVRVHADGPGRTVAAALPPEAEHALLERLNAVLLAPDAPATVVRATFAPEVRAVLRGGWPVTRSAPPAAVPARGRLRVWDDGHTVRLRTPAYERWGDRLATGFLLVGFGVGGTCVLACLGAAGLMGGLPLWFQLGVASLPAALFSVVPLVYGLWAGLGRVTVTVGPPARWDPFAFLNDDPAERFADATPPAEITARWHVGPVGVTWRARAADVRAVWVSGNTVRPGHRAEGVGEPRKVCALTPHAAIPVTGEYLKDSTRTHAAAVVRWALLKHGATLPGLPGER